MERAEAHNSTMSRKLSLDLRGDSRVHPGHRQVLEGFLLFTALNTPTRNGYNAQGGNLTFVVEGGIAVERCLWVYEEAGQQGLGLTQGTEKCLREYCCSVVVDVAF